MSRRCGSRRRSPTAGSQGTSAGYHGYWQVDYTQIDPHLGTNEEMRDLVDDAHGRGMKVYFDVVLNHTGDVISYDEGTFTYRNKTNAPYRDASGTPFDDRDYAGTDTFPELDVEESFPYTPTFVAPGDATAKSPDWLNDRTLYHNRGNSTFAGESSLYGDFAGLDDLFTEHPDVVDGMIEIHTGMIEDFDIDGFRVDTVKHVNDELWERVRAGRAGRRRRRPTSPSSARSSTATPTSSPASRPSCRSRRRSTSASTARSAASSARRRRPTVCARCSPTTTGSPTPTPTPSG